MGKFLTSQSEALFTVAIDFSQYRVSDLKTRIILSGLSFGTGNIVLKRYDVNRVIRYILAEDYLDAKKRQLQWRTWTLTTTVNVAVWKMARDWRDKPQPKNRYPDLLKSASQNCAVSEFIFKGISPPVQKRNKNIWTQDYILNHITTF